MLIHGAFLMPENGGNMKREERIQQIKDIGQTIIDKAESIYGDYECPTNLNIVINMEVNAFPTITVNREFISKIMLDNL